MHSIDFLSHAALQSSPGCSHIPDMLRASLLPRLARNEDTRVHVSGVQVWK